ncbi:proton-coupled zinc antiporter SLC30A1-like [Babylonia areolata]|uniref:proton-coupled zinc antiporter SLC30A1-like n=1 Tax=Babylonia areolata TaxID=304850 RepID=UPI003FCFBCA0
MGRYSGKTCRLLSMLFLTSSFFLVEIIVGYVTNSIALVADSFHMLSDVIALIVGFASIRIAKWPSRKNTFGWVRAEILGALVNAVFLLALCFSILVESLKRLVTVEQIEQPILLLAVGVAGLAVNVIGLFLFHNHAHGHSHGGGSSHSHGGGSHSHGEEVEAKALMVPRDTENTITASTTAVAIELADNPAVKTYSSSQMNMKGVFLHVLGDALGSVVVIISSLIIWKAEGQWRFYVDPAMSILMVIIILSTTIPLLKQTSLILLQTTPNFLDQDSLKLKLQKVDGVLGVHEFHVWQLTGNRIVLSAHILCNNLQEYMDIAAKVKDLFHREGIHSTTVQPEFIEITREPTLECKLPCIDRNRDCIQDTCCGATPKAQAKNKPRKDRKNTPVLTQAESPLAEPSSNSTCCQQSASSELEVRNRCSGEEDEIQLTEATAASNMV